VSNDAPILSLYLNVDPHHRSKEEHKLKPTPALSTGGTVGRSHADIKRAERFFETSTAARPGVACFSCQDRGFWRDYPLPVPVEDFVFVGSRPYITRSATYGMPMAGLG